jgi:hypothetical protein
MPPSGYTRDQSGHVEPMLRSCASALLVEAAENGESILEALAREIDSIEWYMSESARSSAQRGMLLLTQAFYQEVERRSPTTREEFWTAVRAAAQHMEDEILRVKIPVKRAA